MHETRNRILGAAEHLFADRGPVATSLRAITLLADVNLAAVHYHFGDKQGLIRAVMERRGEMVNRQRLLALERLTADDGVQPTLEALLDAYIRPALGTAQEPQTGCYLRLLAQAHVEPPRQWHGCLRRQHRSAMNRFEPQFRRVLPQLDKTELYWRLYFCLGAMIYCMAGRDTTTIGPADRSCNPRDIERVIRGLIDFTAAGLRAPGREYG